LPLADSARVGTSSARRQAWLWHFRADLDVGPLRGNVPTRIKRLADGDFDAILLAGAGIERLAEASDLLDDSLGSVERLRLDPLLFVPAPAQGALAVQCRVGDAAIRKGIAAIDDQTTRAAVELERAALALAEGGCDSAFGAYAWAATSGFALKVMTERSGEILTAKVAGPTSEALAERAIDSLSAANGSAA
jgi:hydroxymethylbilane synthase